LRNVLFFGLLGLVVATNFAITINGTSSCVAPATCVEPAAQYSRVMPVRSRNQWGDSGGYCGSLSVQAIAMRYGAYISQSIVRKSTSNGGGHGNERDGWEILHTNIGEALDNLKLTHDDWNFTLVGDPFKTGYFAWMKKHLINGSPIVWMIECAGDSHATYGIGNYDHIEPVWGIYTNHSLDDQQAYPADVVAHGADYGATTSTPGPTLYREFGSLPDTEAMEGNCRDAVPEYGKNEFYPCVSSDKSQYGYAITGVMEKTPSLPLFLDIDRYDEPDINRWQRPAQLKGTVTINGLKSGTSYKIYRWDDLKNVPVDSNYEDSKYDFMEQFTATATTYVYEDPNTFASDGTTYYRCV